MSFTDVGQGNAIWVSGGPSLFQSFRVTAQQKAADGRKSSFIDA